MAKEKIAIDVDEVLYPFLDEFIAHHNESYGTQVNRDQFAEYEFHIPLGLQQEETIRRIYDFTSKSADIHVNPLQEARDSIAVLSEKFDLVVVTARHKQFEEVTVNWLETHFPNYFKHVELIGYVPIMEKPLTKAAVCLRLGAIALIDDSLSHVTQAANVGVEGILFGDYKWNQATKLPKGVVRCENWPKVLEYLGVK